jgi:hypothetical protein
MCIADFCALHAKITFNHISEIRVLADNIHRTSLDAISTIRTLFFIDDVATNLILADGILWTNFFTFTALSTDKRTEFAWIREFGLYPQCCFLGIYLREVLDSADLQAKPAASTIVPIDFYSHLSSGMDTLITFNKWKSHHDSC